MFCYIEHLAQYSEAVEKSTQDHLCIEQCLGTETLALGLRSVFPLLKVKKIQYEIIN